MEITSFHKNKYKVAFGL